MLSSWQIAALHAQQGQMFSAQQQAVQPLSAQMPQPYGGIGGPGVMSSPFGNPAYGGGPGPGFNYGASSSGGSAFGNAGTALAGGIGRSFSGGLGMMGVMRGFNSAGGMDALKAGNFGRLAGGMALGGGLGMAAGALGQHFFGTMMEGAQEQQGLERTLGRYQFTNPQAFGGRGFSRQDQMGIGDTMRQISRDPAMLTSFGELNQIADKMGQMGLTQGVKSVDDFTKKFTSMVKTLQGMAKQIGTTMEGALQAFGESRAAGFYSDSDIKTNVLRTRMMSATTGMTMDQSLASQRYGAEASHARGGSRRGGGINATRTAMQLGTLNQMGVISNDQIMEMTGKEGADGLQDMAARMQDLGYRMARSSVGTAATLALGEVVDGQYTGKMDPELVEKYRRGEIGKGELMSLAHRKASGRGAKLSFAAHRQRLTTEMVNSTGVEGQAAILQRLLGDRGWENPNAQNLVMQRFGASEEEANMLQQIMPNLKTATLEMSIQTRQEAKAMEKKQILGDQLSLDALKKKISTKISHYTEDWIKDIGTSIRDTLSGAAEDYMTDAAGLIMAQKETKLGQRLARASTGSGGTEQERAGIKRLLAGEDVHQADPNRQRYLASDPSLLTNVMSWGSTKPTVSEAALKGLQFFDSRSHHIGSTHDHSLVTTHEGGIFKRDHYTTSGNQMKDAEDEMDDLSKGKLGDHIMGADPALAKYIQDAATRIENSREYQRASQLEKPEIAHRLLGEEAGLSAKWDSKEFPVTLEEAKASGSVSGGRVNPIDVLTKRAQDRGMDVTSGMVTTAILSRTEGGSFIPEGWKKGLRDAVGVGEHRRTVKGKKAAEDELTKIFEPTEDRDSFSFQELMQQVDDDTSGGKLLRGFSGSLTGGSFDASGKSTTQGDKQLLAIMGKSAAFSPTDKEYLKKAYKLSDAEVAEWDGATKDQVEKRQKLKYTLTAPGLAGEGLDKVRLHLDDSAKEQARGSLEAYKARGVEMINSLSEKGGKNAGKLIDLSNRTGKKSDAIIASIRKQGELAAAGKYGEAEAEQLRAAELYAGLGEGEKGDKLRGIVRGAMGDLGVGEESGILGERLTKVDSQVKKLGVTAKKGKSVKLSDVTSAAELGPEAWAELEKRVGKEIDTKGEGDLVHAAVGKAGSTGLHKVGGGKAAAEETTAKALLGMAQNQVNAATILGIVADKVGKP